MKLIFDQNLSPKLVSLVGDLYPDSVHVFTLNLDQATDLAIWSYAQANNFIIVSKDVDLFDLCVRCGCLPQCVWVRLGNCETKRIADAIRAADDRIRGFVADATKFAMALGLTGVDKSCDPALSVYFFTKVA